MSGPVNPEPSLLGLPLTDPTELTTRLVDRAMAAERDRVDGQLAIRDERLNAMDAATQLRLDRVAEFHAELAQVRSDRGVALAHERELSNERFDAVLSQFQALSSRTAEQKSDTRAAVDAALQAAKELVALQTEAADKSTAKSEASFAKQIDALGLLLQKSSETTDDKIVDLKSRMDRIEATRISAVETKAEVRNTSGDTRAVIALAITVVLAVVTIIGFVLANSPS